MTSRFLIHLQRSIYNLENNIALILGRRFPPDGFCMITANHVDSSVKNTSNTFSLKELLNDTIVWAVPTHRRTLEKRMNRKYGWPNLVWKMLVPKKNLLVCKTCGGPYEIGCICPACYSRVAKETKEMQDAIQAELGLNPVEKEVIVLYKGEKEQFYETTWEGKKIIEMEKERPEWFSKNLLQKSTTPPAMTTDVKPTELA